MAAKPLRPCGVMAASLPPVIITSASPSLDRLEGVADGVGGAGAGGGDRRVRAAQAVLDRHLAAGRVDHQLGDGEGGDLVGPLVQQPVVLDLDLSQAADARAQDHAAAARVFLREVDARVARRRRSPATRANWAKRSSRLTSFGFDVAVGRPVADFAAEADPVVGDVEDVRADRRRSRRCRCESTARPPCSRAR